MKKTILLIAAAFTAFTSFAGGNNIVGLSKKGEGVLSNGFYLNLGVAFPSVVSNSLVSQTFSSGLTSNNYTSVTYSLGVQPNLEIGNQWYFWHNDNVGVGLKVSWFQMGFSSYDRKNINNNITSSQFGQFELRLLKLAPEFTYAINEDIAIDATFEVSPTIQLGGGVDRYLQGTLAGFDITYINAGFGFLMAPGLRFRYKKFAIGTDFGFGTIRTTSAISYSDFATGPTSQVIDNSLFVPRVYLGFQF